jgi:prefoldin subunit 5
MTDEELKELVASLAIAQKKTDEQMNRTDKRIDKMARKIDHVGDIVDGVSKSQGAVTEEFFYNSLAEDNHLGTIHFDGIAPNMSMRLGRLGEEYNIVMTNGDAIGIVEVKYKAHEKDLKKLERKMRNFKKLFPVYKDYKLYGAIASFHFYPEAKEAALNQGFFVLQRSGKVVQTDRGENLLVL